METWKIMLSTSVLLIWIVLVFFMYIINKDIDNIKNVEDKLAKKYSNKTLEVSCKCPRTEPDREIVKEIMKAVSNQPKMISSEMPSTKTNTVAEYEKAQPKKILKDTVKSGHRKNSMKTPILNPPVSGRLADNMMNDMYRVPEQQVTVVTENDDIEEFEGFEEMEDYADFEHDEDYIDDETHDYSRGGYSGTMRGIPNF